MIKFIFDNKGGVVMQLDGKYANKYEDIRSAYNDYKKYKQTNDSSEFSLNTPSLIETEYIDDIKNGNLYLIFSSEEELVDSKTFWTNVREFQKYLRLNC